MELLLSGVKNMFRTEVLPVVTAAKALYEGKITMAEIRALGGM